MKPFYAILLCKTGISSCLWLAQPLFLLQTLKVTLRNWFPWGCKAREGWVLRPWQALAPHVCKASTYHIPCLLGTNPCVLCNSQFPRKPIPQVGNTVSDSSLYLQEIKSLFCRLVKMPGCFKTKRPFQISQWNWELQRKPLGLVLALHARVRIPPPCVQSKHQPKGAVAKHALRAEFAPSTGWPLVLALHTCQGTNSACVACKASTGIAELRALRCLQSVACKASLCISRS